ncbi:MAG TPA: chemotaxis protein CheW [Limnochordia bacterium]|nr:chemotaxis protein CheW [Limnochordia bacterium]
MNGRKESEEFQVVVFSVAGNEFAIPMTVVREIIAAAKLVPLPDMPPAMVGIINVRGSVLPVIDLKARFAMEGGPAVEYNKQRILLAELEESMVGFLVDTVTEVLRVSRQSLEYLDQIQGMNGNIVHSICKVGERLLPIVDTSKLLSNQETKQLEEAAKERGACSAI